MHKLTSKWVMVGTLIGSLFGLLMTFGWRIPNEKTTLLDAHRLINAPAFWCANLWTYHLNLPPRGEVAWVAVPIVAILLQWTLLGFAIGYWRYRALRKSKQN